MGVSNFLESHDKSWINQGLSQDDDYRLVHLGKSSIGWRFS